MKIALLAIPTLLLFTACASNYSAVHMEAGKVKFVGETAGALSGDSDFILTSSSGITCEGSYEYTHELSGTGNIVCSDSKEGNFVFTSERSDKKDTVTRIIKGYGEFKDGTKFTITFGESHSRYFTPSNNYEETPIYKGESTPNYKGQIDINL